VQQPTNGIKSIEHTIHSVLLFIIRNRTQVQIDAVGWVRHPLPAPLNFPSSLPGVHPFVQLGVLGAFM